MYTQTIEAILAEYNLDKNSSIVFEFLIGVQKASISEISQSTKLNRTSCYNYVKDLEMAGLVNFVKENGIQIASVRNHENIIFNLKDRAETKYQNKLSKIKHLDQILKIISGQKKELGAPNVEVFRGKDALKLIYKKSLEADIMVAYFNPWLDEENKLIDEWHTEERVSKRIPIKIILPNRLNSKEFISLKKDLKETKILDNFAFDGMKIVTNKLILNYSDVEQTGVCIESEFLAQNEIKIFNKLWNLI